LTSSTSSSTPPKSNPPPLPYLPPLSTKALKHRKRSITADQEKKNKIRHNVDHEILMPTQVAPSQLPKGKPIKRKGTNLGQSPLRVAPQNEVAVPRSQSPPGLTRNRTTPLEEHKLVQRVAYPARGAATQPEETTKPLYEPEPPPCPSWPNSLEDLHPSPNSSPSKIRSPRNGMAIRGVFGKTDMKMSQFDLGKLDESCGEWKF
jgi:hypothetical protein